MAAFVHQFTHLIRRLKVRFKQILLIDSVYPDTLVFHRYLYLQVLISAIQCLHSDEDHSFWMRELDSVREQIDQNLLHSTFI